MGDSSLPPLTFAAIEARIHAMPEGPVSIFDTPRWAFALYAIGAVAAFLGVLPSLLIHVWEPRTWMIWMARSGLLVMCCACALPFLRSLWVVSTEMLRFRESMIDQMDHDQVVFSEVARWLAQYPKSVLADRLQFAQHVQATLQAKLGFLAGTLDKLGLLPAVATVLIALQNWNGVRQILLWLAIAGIFLSLCWLICVLTAAIRLRVNVFEAVLNAAMRRQELQKPKSEPTFLIADVF